MKSGTPAFAHAIEIQVAARLHAITFLSFWGKEKLSYAGLHIPSVPKSNNLDLNHAGWKCDATTVLSRHTVLDRPWGRGSESLVLANAERAGRQNSRPESAATAQRLFCAGAERLIHPIAGATFLSAEEVHALNFKFLADEFVQVQAARNDVSAEDRRRFVPDAELLAEGLIHLVGEERNLAFVVRVVVEEPVALDAPASHTTGRSHFADWVLPRGPAVLAEIIVPRRHVQMQHLNRPFHLNRIP